MRGHSETGACYRDPVNPCREPACRKRESDYQAERRRVRILRARRGEITFKHGRNGYNHFGCRCETCVTAARDYMAERKAAA